MAMLRGLPRQASIPMDGTAPLARRPGAGTRLIGWLRRWRAARQAAWELAQIDDRTLADMGVSRCELPRVLLPPGPVWK